MHISDWSSDVCSSDLVHLRVVGIAEQQRYDDDLVIAGPDQLRHHGAEGRLGELQERRLDAQVWAHLADFRNEGGDRLGGPRITASVCEGNQSRSSHGYCLPSRSDVNDAVVADGSIPRLNFVVLADAITCVSTIGREND